MKIKTPIQILIRRRAAIGDVIMSTAVVREFKRRYPESIIDVMTDEPEVYRNNPHIDKMFLTSAPPEVSLYDIYVNLDDAYEANPGNNYIDSYFYRAFGPGLSCNKNVELFPSAEDCSLVSQDLQAIGDRFIVVHMRNWHWAAKNISPDIWFDVYARVFEQRADFKIVTVGGMTDFFVEEHPLFVDVRGRYNCQQIKYLCDHAKAFVGIDSGPYWSAAASTTNIIALLTHLSPEHILPYRDFLEPHLQNISTTAIQTNELCRGCNTKQSIPVRQIVCQHGDYRCTNNFDTTAIANEILKHL